MKIQKFQQTRKIKEVEDAKRIINRLSSLLKEVEGPFSGLAGDVRRNLGSIRDVITAKGDEKEIAAFFEKASNDISESDFNDFFEDPKNGLYYPILYDINLESDVYPEFLIKKQESITLVKPNDVKLFNDFTAKIKDEKIAIPLLMQITDIKIRELYREVVIKKVGGYKKMIELIGKNKGTTGTYGVNAAHNLYTKFSTN